MPPPSAVLPLRVLLVTYTVPTLLMPPPKMVKLSLRALSLLKVEKHPDKIFVGRIERGFDFLGYHFSPGGLSLAPKTSLHP